MAAVELRVIDLRGKSFDSNEANRLVPRASLNISQAVEAILPLLEAVRTDGEDAIVKVTLERDGVDPRPIKVSQEEIDDAVKSLDSKLRAALEESISRVRSVSSANLPSGSSVQLADGALVHQRWQPVESVGLYVPGGKAVYPSSVIMNVVPAQVANVSKLAVASPAQKEFNGRPHPTVLAAAGLLGVKDVFCMGGPAAIAAFAYGLPEVGLDPVNLVTGPGNIFVAAAKRALRGTIGIDSEAGTTEILIIADADANANFVAHDLLSQAEHDEAAASVLVTDSPQLVDDVIALVSNLIDSMPGADRARAALEGQQSAVVLVDNLDEAVRFSNFYATEHLEIQTNNNQEILKKITNAGAIFLGEYSPVSLGDYLAGSNHVLPTGQQAKFGAGLGVHTFLRPQQIIEYNRVGLSAVSQMVHDFSAAEGLPAHGQAVTARFQD